MSHTTEVMASTQLFQLPLYDTQQIKNELIKKSKNQKSFIAKLLSDLSKGIDEPTTTTENLTHLSASNLTAREVMSRLARVQDVDLRNKLSESIVPYIVGSSDEQLLLALNNLDPDELKKMVEEKGDIGVQEQTMQNAASAINVKVYYAKCLLIRENGKYNLNFAYYHFNLEVPQDSLRAIMRSENEINSDLSLAKVAAYNTLHRLLHRVWPNRIQLQLLSTLPDQ